MKYIKETVIKEIEVKKSKFICILRRINNENDLKDFINQAKKDFPSATHYCYGAIINGTNRSNDDGEPASTAGKPILESIKRAELDNTIAIVVRYFGGTLLGTAGLVKAYSDATKEAINFAAFTKPVTVSNYKVSIDYSLTNRLENLLKNEAEIKYRYFANEVTYYFQSEKDFTNEISAISNGTSKVEFISQETIEK